MKIATKFKHYNTYIYIYIKEITQKVPVKPQIIISFLCIRFKRHNISIKHNSKAKQIKYLIYISNLRELRKYIFDEFEKKSNWILTQNFEIFKSKLFPYLQRKKYSCCWKKFSFAHFCIVFDIMALLLILNCFDNFILTLEKREKLNLLFGYSFFFYSCVWTFFGNNNGSRLQLCILRFIFDAH